MIKSCLSFIYIYINIAAYEKEEKKMYGKYYYSQVKNYDRLNQFHHCSEI